MRTVTALHPERRDRVRIDLDGEAWRTVPAGAVVSAGLCVGVGLDRERARELRRALLRVNALQAAGRALEHRDRSAAELEALLARRGIRAGERATAVETMQQLGYLDDTRFGRGRAEALAGRGYGDDAIAFDLEQRGLGADVVAEAIAALLPEAERARTILAGSAPSARLVRKLLAKGFSADAVETAFGTLD
jgi:SOS response regulatory protein OraA/RecX